jgi:hypothetical protein
VILLRLHQEETLNAHSHPEDRQEDQREDQVEDRLADRQEDQAVNVNFLMTAASVDSPMIAVNASSRANGHLRAEVKAEAARAQALHAQAVHDQVALEQVALEQVLHAPSAETMSEEKSAHSPVLLPASVRNRVQNRHFRKIHQERLPLALLHEMQHVRHPKLHTAKMLNVQMLMLPQALPVPHRRLCV